MTDTRFFPKMEPLTLGDVAAMAEGELINGDPQAEITGVSAVEDAQPGDMVSVHNRRYKRYIENSQAGLVLTTPELLTGLQPKVPVIACEQPYLIFALAGAKLFVEWPEIKPGIHPRAVVDETAKVDPGAMICAGAVIGAQVEIGAGTKVGPNAVIDDNVIIGKGNWIGANASISYSLIGDNNLIHSNVSLGNRGYGFTPSPTGIVNLPQYGLVIIGNGVELGAGTVLDRGSVRNTVVGDQSKLGAMVSVGHNVQIGKFCTIVSQVGIAGSTTIEDFVMIGGHAGINGHITLKQGSKVGPFTPILRSTKPGQEVLSYPPLTAREQLRRHENITKLLAREGFS